jgi:putative ABC transport system permease protein
MIRTDLVAAARMWLRTPSVPLAVVLSLSIGIGAATGVFAVSDAALWRPYAIPDPGRVAWIESTDRGAAGETAPGVVAAWQSRARRLQSVAAVRAAQATVRDDRGADRISGAEVTATMFDTLGVRPAAGRVFGSEEERAGADRVVVLSHRLWRARYGGSLDVIGRVLDFDGRPRTVIAVAPPELDELPFAGDWWTPLVIDPAAAPTGPRYLAVLARLSAGATFDGAADELNDINESIGAVGDTGLALAARVTPLGDAFAAPAARILYPMLGAIGVVLLMASVNAATFSLAHGHQRRLELAVRAALGASHAALVRQLLIESASMALAAALIGLLLSQWIVDGLKALLPANVPRLEAAAVDGRAVLFLTMLSAAIGLCIGILTAWRHARGTRVGHALAGARGVVGGQERWRAGFVVVQVALAVTMAVAGLVAMDTSRALAAVVPGYRAEGVLTAALRLPIADYPTGDAVRRAVERLAAAVEEQSPGGRAALATRVPLSGGAPGSDLALATDSLAPGVDRQVRVRFVTPSYFDVIGTPIVAGRGLTAGDRDGARRVVLVNQTLANRLAERGGVIGQAVIFSAVDFNPQPRTLWQVVGIAGDVRDRGPREEVEPEVYVSMAQGPPAVLDWIGRQVLLVARADRGNRMTPALLRDAARGVDPRLALFDVMTLEQRLRQHLSTERLLNSLLVPLGAAGLALTGFGVFALATHVVNGRRREIAVRLVLGATPGRLMAVAARRGLAVVMAGAVLGAVGATAVDRALEAVAFGTRAADVRHLSAVLAVVVLTTLAAIWVPLRRATRRDPGLVLREE